MYTNEHTTSVRHFILLASDYVNHRRVCVDVISEEEFKRVNKELLEQLGTPSAYSFYSIATYSKNFESVKKKDHFYDNVEKISSINKFIKIIKRTREIKALDIAPLIILGAKYCSPLKLQKLLFYCYAEFLIEYDKKLFNEKIEAWSFGPVVREVYDKYKNFKKNNIPINEDMALMAYSSRIYQADLGPETMKIINRVLGKLGESTASQLAEMIRVEKGPWERTYSKSKNEVISDEAIKRYYTPLEL